MIILNDINSCQCPVPASLSVLVSIAGQSVSKALITHLSVFGYTISLSPKAIVEWFTTWGLERPGCQFNITIFVLHHKLNNISPKNVENLKETAGAGIIFTLLLYLYSFIEFKPVT